MALERKNKNVINLILLSLFILGFVWVVFDTLQFAMTIYFFLLLISMVVYNQKDLQSNLEGIEKKNNLRSLIFGIIFGGGFFFITFFVPGFSIGIPKVPASIATIMQTFVIVLVAPVVETIFVQGALFSFLRERLGDKRILLSITLQAIFFSLLHLSAYISGFYDYPDFVIGASVFFANIGAFITAFLFAFVAGWFVTKKRINLLFVIVFHALINLIVYTSLTISII